MTARWLLELLTTVWMPYAPKSLRSTPVPVDLFNLLTGPELLEMTETYQPEHRERLYSPTVTLSMFMKQALDVDRFCDDDLSRLDPRAVRLDGPLPRGPSQASIPIRHDSRIRRDQSRVLDARREHVALLRRVPKL